MTDAEVERRLREFFAQNYEVLKLEGGHALTPEGRRQAEGQVLNYWRKLKNIAMTVKETEVKLGLPGQKTNEGREFVVEGVVDIVQEGNQTLMYDLKTHEAKDVRAEREFYQDQLNVYAHIWKGVRQEKLDGTAIIATRLPEDMRDAMRANDRAALDAAFDAWDPVVEFDFDEKDVGRTLRDFACVVDSIENGEFSPPPASELRRVRKSRRKGKSKREYDVRFADLHCRDCDGRFSCKSYREYATGSRRGGSRIQFRRYIEDHGAEQEIDDWIAATLED